MSHLDSKNVITRVETQLFRIPLREVMSDAMHGDHTHFELITVTIEVSSGVVGTGYSYTGGYGGHAIVAMMEHDLAPWLLGKDAENVELLNQNMQWHIHYVGRGGVASFAVSATDIALWDIRCKTAGLPLWQVAGGHGSRCRAYCGGIDLNLTQDALLANISGYLDRGFNAVKIKVGQPELGLDIERVAAVRKLIGPDMAFMVDANYGLSVAQAITASEAFKPYNLTWFEEPIDPDNLEGYAEIASKTTVPLAMGENLHTTADFRRALEQANLAYLQPDSSNCCGITGWLQAARMSADYALPVCSHGMQELHVSLVSSQPHGAWIEVHSFPIDEYTTQPLVVEDCLAVAPETPGTGVEFCWESLSPHRKHVCVSTL